MQNIVFSFFNLNTQNPSALSIFALMKKKKEVILPNITITDLAAEGKAVAKPDGKAIFVKNAVPGDVVDLKITRSKSSFAEAEAIAFHKYSDLRTNPACSHFGICGGCARQDLAYENQLAYKQQWVLDAFQRIGKFPFPTINPILGCNHIFRYRNKMEYGFTDFAWLTNEQIQSGQEFERRGVGLHIPGKFDKILNIDSCFLQNEWGDLVRNWVRNYAIENDISFFHIRNQVGMLRTILLRIANTGEKMVLIAFTEDNQEIIQPMLSALLHKFPDTTSLLYVINNKKNDTIYDLPVHVFHGKDFIIEKLHGVQYKIGPKSFFQTNTEQAQSLYKITKEFAELTGKEKVYDLYTGTGSIACYIADLAEKVIGVEYVPEAVEDAFVNKELNALNNVDFYAGDMKDVLNDSFISIHGVPDVVITDPPRAGMHEDVVKTLLRLNPKLIVYVSCNVATQARDLSLLTENYIVTKIQPVDMFPHTHHVENVVQLKRKDLM